MSSKDPLSGATASSAVSNQSSLETTRDSSPSARSSQSAVIPQNNPMPTRNLIKSHEDLRSTSSNEFFLQVNIVSGSHCEVPCKFLFSNVISKENLSNYFRNQM